MRSVILYCQHLGRDIDALRIAVPHAQIYQGARTPKGEDGCLDSHKAIIREAQLLREPRVFVMEDDCQFTAAFDWDQWVADADWAEAQGYDVLVGGSTRTYEVKLVRTGHPRIDITTVSDASPRFLDACLSMFEVSAFHSAHCVVYFESGYEKALHAVQPYDLSLGRDCLMRCVLVHPFVAVQKPSYSGILQEHVNYVPYYHQHENLLRSLL